jgi:Tfp pilus assembly protein PilN
VNKRHLNLLPKRFNRKNAIRRFRGKWVLLATLFFLGWVTVLKIQQKRLENIENQLVLLQHQIEPVEFMTLKTSAVENELARMKGGFQSDGSIRPSMLRLVGAIASANARDSDKLSVSRMTYAHDESRQTAVVFITGIAISRQNVEAFLWNLQASRLFSKIKLNSHSRRKIGGVDVFEFEIEGAK